MDFLSRAGQFKAWMRQNAGSKQTARRAGRDKGKATLTSRGASGGGEELTWHEWRGRRSVLCTQDRRKIGSIAKGRAGESSSLAGARVRLGY